MHHDSIKNFLFKGPKIFSLFFITFKKWSHGRIIVKKRRHPSEVRRKETQRQCESRRGVGGYWHSRRGGKDSEGNKNKKEKIVKTVQLKAKR